MNRSDRYRLEALLEIAWAGPEVLAISEIARRRRIPTRYLAHLLNGLRHDGWVVARRGPGGGFTLGHDPAAIPISTLLGRIPPQQLAAGAVGRLERRLLESRDAALDGLTLADLLAWERRSPPAPEFII